MRISSLLITKCALLIATLLPDCWLMAQSPKCVKLGSHRSYGSAAAFRPGTHTLVTGCEADGDLRFWDAAKKQEVLSLSTDVARVTAIAYSDDGTKFAVSGLSGSIEVRDSTSLKRIDTVSIKPESARLLQFSRHTNDLFAVVVYGVPSRVVRWDLEARKSVNVLQISDATFPSFRMKSDKSAMFVGLDSGVQEFIGADLANPRATFSTEGRVRSIAIDADEKRIAASSGSRLRVWDITRPTSLCDLMAKDTDEFGKVTFFPKNVNRLAVVVNKEAGLSSTVLLYDCSQGKEVTRIEVPSPRICDITFSDDERWLAAIACDGAVYLCPIGE